MFKFKLKTEFALRLGLALVLIYAGVNILAAPENWLGFVPAWVETVINREIFLTVHAIVEILLGLLLIINFQTAVVSFLVFFDFLAILVFYGVDEITFRDFGLMMTALALFLTTVKMKEKNPTYR